eukprot:478466-Prorocentrum_lima.AAC.1
MPLVLLEAMSRKGRLMLKMFVIVHGCPIPDPPWPKSAVMSCVGMNVVGAAGFQQAAPSLER